MASISRYADKVPSPGEPESFAVVKDTSSRKRKRRILSCDACRKLKCRCELREGSDICARCRALRIPCVKSHDYDQPASTCEGLAQTDLSTRYYLQGPPNFSRKLKKSRLLQLESSVLSIKSTLENLRSDRGPVLSDESARTSTMRIEEIITEKDLNGNDIDLADQHVYASPAEVMRKVSNQLSMGYRRTFDTCDDLVCLEILDISIANALISSFIRRHRHVLLIDTESDLSSSGNLRQDSPFLYSVCCLLAMRHDPLAKEEPAKHRLAYEHVRQMLGQVMLASPLRTEEITGILIMALFAVSPSRGPEYVDSWLLSGHCAQQAMLSINFSEIVTRVSRSTSTPTDQRSIRLWASICLVNLHWSTTTGRPTVLPTAYLRQCRILLNFDQATMRDGMLLAEIALYSLLEQMSSQRPYIKSDGRNEEFASWKQKWNYLLHLPTAWRLNLSYHIACLILSRQSFDCAARDEKHDSVGHNSGEDCNATKTRQIRVSNSAAQVIATFVSIPSSDCENLPEFYKLCVAYSMLILAQYEQNPTHTSRTEIVRHLEEVQKRCNQTPGSSLAVRFSVERALKRFLESKITENESKHSGEKFYLGHDPIESLFSANKGPSALESELQHQDADDIQTLLSTDTPPSVSIGQNMFEDMDVFFSGGYLGLGDPLSL